MEGSTLAARLDDKIAGVCLIAAALLYVPTTQFEYSSKGMLFWAGLLGLIVYILLVPGLLGIARQFRQAAPRLSVVAGLLASVGCVSGASFQTALLHEWAARTAGTPEVLMAAILDTTKGQVFPVLVIFTMQFPIALLLLSVGLVRTGSAPTWVAALLAIGAVVFPIGHIGSMLVVQHLAETILLVPMVWLGLRLLREAPTREVAVTASTSPHHMAHL